MYFLLNCLCVFQQVMDKVYKLIVSMYVKYLIQTNKSKLEKCWNPNVGQRIREDAEQLHKTFSELVRSAFGLLVKSTGHLSA